MKLIKRIMVLSTGTILSFGALFGVSGVNHIDARATATTTNDVLTQATFTLKNDTTYGEYTSAAQSSGAVYVACMASPGQNQQGAGSIQLRSNNNTSGIVSTTSGGVIKSVSVNWNEQTDSSRVLSVYGSNTPFLKPSDLYSSLTAIGEISKASNATLNIEETYEYIGVRSKSGALYLNNITFTWGEAAIETPVTSVSIVEDGINTSIYEGETLKLRATVLPEEATMKTLEWSVINADPVDCVTVDEEGLVTANKAGTAEVVATSTDGSNVSDSVTITVLEDTLESLSYTGTPVQQYIGKAFDPTGLVFTAKWTNKGEVEVEHEDLTFDKTSLVATDTSVVATYLTKSCTVEGFTTIAKPVYERITNSLLDIGIGDLVTVVAETSGVYANGLSGDFITSNTATFNEGFLTNEDVYSFAVFGDPVNGFALKNKEGYLAKVGNKKLGIQNKPYAWSVELIDGKVKISSHDGYDLVYNTSSPRFTVYSNGWTNTSMEKPTLYALRRTNEDVVKEFVDTMMHMTDYTESTGACAGENGYYAKAKEALMGTWGLTDAQVALFQSDSTFDAAQERYEAWARANGDTVNMYNRGTSVTNASNMLAPYKGNNNLLIIVVSVSCLMIFVGTVLIYRKKKLVK